MNQSIIFNYCLEAVAVFQVIKDPQGKVTDFTVTDYNPQMIRLFQAEKKYDYSGVKISEIYSHFFEENHWIHTLAVINKAVSRPGMEFSEEHFFSIIRKRLKIRFVSEDPEQFFVFIHETEFKKEQMMKLSQISLSLQNLHSQSEVFNYIGLVLNDILPENIDYILLSADKDQKHLSIYSDSLLSENPVYQFISRNLNITQSYEIRDDMYSVYRQKKLHHHEEGILNHTSPHYIPSAIVKKAVQMLHLEEIYTIGLSDEYTLFGDIHFITREKDIKPDAPYIENLIYLFSGALTRVKIEKKAEKQRKHFEEVTSQIDEIFFVFDIHSKCFTYLSPAYKKITGYPVLEKMSFKQTEKMIFPDDLQSIQNHLNHLSALKETRNSELSFRIITKYQEIRWINLHIYQIPDGQSPKITGVAKDITLTRNYQKRLENALNHIHEVFWILDIQSSDFIFINESLERISGYSSIEVMNISQFLSILHPEDQKSFQDIIQSKNDCPSYHIRLITKSGEIRNLNMRCFINQKDQEIIGTMTDITDTIHKEQTLQQISSVLNDVFFMLNIREKSEIEFLNPDAFEKLTGYPFSKLDDHHELISKIHQNERHRFYDMIKSGPSDNGYYPVFECQIQKKNGRWVWLNIKSRPIYDENQQVIKIAGLIQDMTNFKEKEIMIKNNNRKLEKVNHNLLMLLSRLSHEIKNPLNGIIGLSQILSTCLTEPVQQNYILHIRSSADTILRVLSDILEYSKLKDQKPVLHKQEFSLISLTENIVSNHAFETYQKNIDLNLRIYPGFPEKISGDDIKIRQILINLINNAVKYTEQGSVDVDISFRQNNQESEMITAVFQISDTGPGIAEEEQNKIFHEFHRINHKGKTDDLSYGLGLPIVKTLTEVMQGTISVESMVGKGSKFIVQIPLEIIQKKIKKEADQTYPVLFHDLPKKKAEILREYLEYQNCYQTFYSDQQNIEEILKKQTFNTAVIYHRNKSEDDRLRNLFIKYGIKHFYLIIKPANPENSFSSGFSSHVIYEPVLLSVIENLFCHSQQFIENNFHQKLTCSQLKDKKILIVEDDALNALLMKKILTPYQCEPVIAEYGKEALQLFREKTFDAVLLDINLPDINGIEVLRQFRKIPKKENIPVFALTGTDSFTEEDSKLFSGLLSKPYQSYEILSALKQVFS